MGDAMAGRKWLSAPLRGRAATDVRNSVQIKGGAAIKL